MEQNSQKIITPGMGAWIVATIIGVIAPLFLQEQVATAISELAVESTLTSSILLITIVLGYMLSLSFLVFFLVISKKIHVVFALTLLFFGPVFIWLMLPYLI